ncbi:MAG: hypothetical protein HN368_16840 [Spirochaetales bacterium]|jgi:hypothetical protein|nr:hypothetical protein [Spirochaetales bacterium]
MKRLFFFMIFVSAASLLLADETVSGQVVVAHAGYENHVFVKSFIYIEEIDTHFPIEPDGSFKLIVKDAGMYSFGTICPGFKPTSFHKYISAEEDIIIEVSLQVLSMRVEVTQEIPRFIINVRESAESISREKTDLTDNEYHSLLQSSNREDWSPGINIGRIIDFIRQRIEENRNK